MTLEEIDRATVFHPATDLRAHASGALGTPRIIESGDGIYITDRQGRRLLNAFAGLYCVNVGYGRRTIADAIYAQAKKLAYYHAYVGHSNEPLIRLSARIIDMAPAGMSEPEFAQYCAGELERLILDEGPDTVAAFIGEPVLGTGGIVPPPEGTGTRSRPCSRNTTSC